MPESPIRHSGSPLRIQSPLASSCTVAGLIAVLASKSKSPSHLSRGNPAALTRRTVATAVVERAHTTVAVVPVPATG